MRHVSDSSLSFRSPERLSGKAGRRLAVVSLATLLVIGSGCVYRQDVQQGNEITREMVAQIEPGMTKREVVRTLGLPLINDPFNSNRWDYFYSLKKGLAKEAEKQSATLLFDGDILQTVQINIPEEE